MCARISQLFVLSLLAFCSAVTCVVWAADAQKIESVDWSFYPKVQMQTQEFFVKLQRMPPVQQEYFLKNPKQRVSDRFIPIAIFVFEGDNISPRGMATLETSFSGMHLRIITSAHLFSEDWKGGKTFYCLLSDVQKDRSRVPFYGVSKFYTLKGASGTDVIIGVPGKASVIKPFWSSVKTISGSISALHKINNQGNNYLTSLGTGERALFVGSAKLIDGLGKEDMGVNYLALIKTVPSMSGSGFVDADGMLYVLAGSMGVSSGLRKELLIPPSFNEVARFIRVVAQP